MLWILDWTVIGLHENTIFFKRTRNKSSRGNFLLFHQLKFNSKIAFFKTCQDIYFVSFHVCQNSWRFEVQDIRKKQITRLLFAVKRLVKNSTGHSYDVRAPTFGLARLQLDHCNKFSIFQESFDIFFRKKNRNLSG